MKNVLKIILLISLCLISVSCSPDKKKLVFFAGNSIHLWGDHENELTCNILASYAAKSFPNVDIKVFKMAEGAKISDIKNADAIFVIAEGEANNPLNNQQKALENLSKNGANFAIFHYALQPQDRGQECIIDAIVGAHYEPYWSVNPSWKADLVFERNNRISNGVADFTLDDEWYFNMRFVDEKNIVPVVKAIPPDKVRSRRFGAHSGNEYVAKNKGKSEIIMWTYTTINNTKGLGFCGGHSVWALCNDNYRKMLLNSIAFLLDEKIPENGIESEKISIDEIEKRISKDKRRDYDYYMKNWHQKIEGCAK